MNTYASLKYDHKSIKALNTLHGKVSFVKLIWWLFQFHWWMKTSSVPPCIISSTSRPVLNIEPSTFCMLAEELLHMTASKVSAMRGMQPNYLTADALTWFNRNKFLIQFQLRQMLLTLNLMNFLIGISHFPIFGTLHYKFTDNLKLVNQQYKAWSDCSGSWSDCMDMQAGLALYWYTGGNG